MACDNHVIIDLPTGGFASRRFDVGSVLQRSRALLFTWLIRCRGRRALSDLNDHLLSDIGLTRAEAARAKPLWRP